MENNVPDYAGSPPRVKPRAVRKRPPALFRVADNSDPRARIADSADAAGWWSHEARPWDVVHSRAHSKRGISHEVSAVGAAGDRSSSQAYNSSLTLSQVMCDEQSSIEAN